VDFTRTFPLEDVSIRSGGDGRTVDAYAAVFDQPVKITDGEGTYNERIAPTAFAKTLSDNGTRFQVLFNHGMTVHRTPSERFSMPLGVPLEVTADRRGLFTSTRYNATPLADEVLEGIKSGTIRGQSFSGGFLRSDPPAPRGGYRANRSGELQTVTRQEVRMQEYGPTPFPAYPEAGIVGVRAAQGLLGQDQRLLDLILSADDSALDPIVRALTITDADADSARTLLAEIIADEPEPHGWRMQHLQNLATRLGPTSETPTPPGAGTDGPPNGHPGRLPAKTLISMGRILKGSPQ
jgi:HK97 family phage prohead protease